MQASLFGLLQAWLILTALSRAALAQERDTEQGSCYGTPATSSVIQYTGSRGSGISTFSFVVRELMGTFNCHQGGLNAE